MRVLRIYEPRDTIDICDVVIGTDHPLYLFAAYRSGEIYLRKWDGRFLSRFNMVLIEERTGLWK